MRIVIDVPDRIYKRQGYLNIIDSDILRNALKNGTPLPKGHGELVYREDVCNELRYMDNNGFITRSVNHVIEDIKKGVPTIIEADISGKEIER